MMRTFEVLLISVFLSRVMADKNELGELLQIIFISSIIVTMLSGFPLAMNFFYGKYKGKEEKENLFVKFILSTFAITITLCILIFIFKSGLGSSFKNQAIENNIYVVLLFFIIKTINSIFPNYHYLKKKLDKYLILYTITTIFLIGFFFYDYYASTLNAFLIFQQLLFVELLRMLINIFIINLSELNFRNIFFNKNEWVYVITISFGVILGAFNLYIDKYLIAIMLNPTEFVFYQNGAINLPFVNIITSSLFIASIPTFADLYTKGEFLKLIKETKKLILKCSILLLPILVYCFFEAIPLIKMLYGDDFQISGEIFKVYILRYIFSVMAFSIYMGSIGLEKKSNLIILLTALIGLGLNLVLIPYYGIIGAAWAIVIASLSTIFISFVYISIKLKTHFYDYFPLKNYIKILITSILLYIPFHILNLSLEFHHIVLISSFIYYIIVILILNTHFKFFNLPLSRN
ncbi:MAG: polysaccharide biosynthesis C-terminal domain-containing protein [Sediminicola sp.]